MGITKFTSTFIEPLTDYAAEAYREVQAVFVDGNPLVYYVVAALRKVSTKVDPVDGKSDRPEDTMLSVAVSSEDEFWQLVERFTKEVVQQELVGVLHKFAHLKHITFCLDGMPCAGKLMQQWLRRKNPVYFCYTKEGKNVIALSDAMILPGSKMLRLFGATVIEALTSTFAKNGCTLEFSLDNVPGEGEHKMLDYYRYTTGYTKCLLWSNDSDVPVCLLSSRPSNGVYIKTNVTKFVGEQGDRQQTNEEKIYRVADLVNVFCGDVKDIDNCQLLITFFGNDFAPQMINTGNIQKAYRAFVQASVPKVAPGDVPRGKTSFLDKEGLFSASGMLAWLNEFDDYAFYFEPYAVFTSKVDNTVRRLRQFEAFTGNTSADADIETKLAFKRHYYVNVISQECPQMKDALSDTRIHEFEMEMAVDYMRVFVWYHYYANGWYLPMNADSESTPSVEPYYAYNYPPLFDSLRKVLVEPELRTSSGRCLNDILGIRPRRRQLTYWGSLPRYQSPLIQAFAVLQKRDLDSVQSAFGENANALISKVVEARKEVEHMYAHQPAKSLFLKTRLTERVDLPAKTTAQTTAPLARSTPASTAAEMTSSAGTLAPATAKPATFRIENVGLRVHMKPDIPALMSRIATAVGVLSSSDPIETLTVGEVKHSELCETRNRMFAVDGYLDM